MKRDTCVVGLPHIRKIKLSNGKDEVLTPYRAAKELVDLMPEEVFNPKSTFCDIYFKNEALLDAIERRLLNSKYMNIPELKNPVDRLYYIRRMQLFAICPHEYSFELARNYFSVEQLKYCRIPDKHLFRVYEQPFCVYEQPFCVGKANSTRDAVERVLKSIIEYQRNGFDDKPEDKVYREFLKDTFIKEIKQMKFDVIVGNPPYNNDAYLDFVTDAHEMSNQYTCMITPAKWQAKTDGKPENSKTEDKNEKFRRDIVPYMDKIVFNSITGDLFDIREVSGISHFVLGKHKQDNKLIKVKCSRNKCIESDFEEHDEKSVTLCNRRILNVIGKFGQLGEGFKQSLYVKNTDNGENSISGQLGFKRFTYTSEQERGEKLRQADMVEVMQGEKVVGYKKIDDLFTTYKLDKYKITTSVMAGNIELDMAGKTLAIVPCNILKPYQVPKGSFPVLKYFDTMEECISFSSYYSTRCVAFLFLFGACGSTLTKEFFRFVPDPNDWTCTYVDAPHPNVEPDEKGYYELDGKRYCSLYVRYKLTKDDINIIESVIKERK